MSEGLLYVSTKRYVYFDEEGNLTAVSNVNTEPGNYVEVEFADIENLITGKEHFFHYYIAFDTASKSYVLKHKLNEEDFTFDVNNQIYKIPNSSARTDIKIIQDIPNKKWTIVLDEIIRDNFKSKKMIFTKSLNFSFTRYNDPHQLEKFLTIELNSLIEQDLHIDFENQIELDPNALSVYTIKRLETYSHEVLNG
jgi:hypothetical protein